MQFSVSREGAGGAVIAKNRQELRGGRVAFVEATAS
jgi:hypothetical protein